ncbi:MAG: hypothetical protein ACKV2Q_00595 [Planctomycetaceae bacterium]
MAIRYECEQCGSVLKIKEDLAGKPGKCPKCKTAFTVPTPESDPDRSSETATQAKASSASAAADDAEPMLATTKPGSSSDDFDLDAFLRDDDAGKSKTAKSRPSQPRRKVEQSDDAQDGSDRQAKKANPAEAGEAFSIRRGPDSADKYSKRTPVPGQEDEAADEPPSPARRPPGTNPNAPASNIASDLLAKSAKKGKKNSWSEIGAEKKEEGQFDWEGMRREVLKKYGPLVVGGGLLCWLLFQVVGSSFGNKPFVPPLGAVTGTVTLNAKPIVGAEVWFYPTKSKITVGDKEFKVTASTGITDAAGHYELTYIGELKGAVVGECRVQIVAAGYPGIAAQYLGIKATATQTVKKGSQTIDLELSK